MLMNFDLFRASARPVADLGAALPPGANDYFYDENGAPRVQAGIVYLDDCFIETLPDGQYMLTIENDSSMSADLPALERKLYNWIVGYFADEFELTETEQLARNFAARVLADLDETQRAALLANPTGAPFCLSHDFLDPNQYMLDAREEMTGFDDFDFDRDGALFDDAWRMAREFAWFTL